VALAVAVAVAAALLEVVAIAICCAGFGPSVTATAGAMMTTPPAGTSSGWCGGAAPEAQVVGAAHFISALSPYLPTYVARVTERHRQADRQDRITQRREKPVRGCWAPVLRGRLWFVRLPPARSFSLALPDLPLGLASGV